MEDKYINYEENMAYLSRLHEAIEAAAELIELAWLLIYDTDLPDSEKLEKIGNAINIFYDKYGNEDV